MQSYNIAIGAHVVRVHQWGQGSRGIIAWHGFRQNGQAFAKMGHFLPEGYTLYAPDLPFHGETKWQADEYDTADLWAIVTQIPGCGKEQKIVLAGFSLGGYMAGGMALEQPHRVARLLLLAPDTSLTAWGWLTHRIPYAWRIGLQRWFNKPGRLLHWADRLYRFGLIDRFALTFLHRTVADQSRRRQLFGTWRARAHFPFTFAGLAKLDCPLQVVLGTEDPLIPADKVQKRMAHSAAIMMIEAGHDLLPGAEHWIDQVL